MNQETQDLMIKTIQDSIKTTVNGKIDHLHEKVDAISTQVTDLSIKMEELKPVRLGVNTLSNIKTGGAFFAGTIAPWVFIVGSIIALFKFLSRF